MRKYITIKEYAEKEGVCPSSIKKRIYRGTLLVIVSHNRRTGEKMIRVICDNTIKKPRKK